MTISNAFDLADVHRITDRIWIGGQLGPDPQMAQQRLAELTAQGLRGIIDCRCEGDDRLFARVHAPQVQYCHLGVADDGTRLPDDWFEAGTEFALSHLRNGHSVLAHCAMGVNRGPSMGFAIMLRLGWGPVQAIARIRERRPFAHVAYAEDALDWWFRRADADDSERRGAHASLQHWRVEHELGQANPVRRLRMARSA